MNEAQFPILSVVFLSPMRKYGQDERKTFSVADGRPGAKGDAAKDRTAVDCASAK